jgi:DNA-binding beta-propeller fold protein YncE
MTARDEYVAFGRQVYRVVRPFAEMPAGLEIGILSKCAVDAEGYVYVAQRADPPVLIFNREGRFVRSVGDGRAADSHGICVTQDGRILLVDRDAHQLLCYSADGDLEFEWGEPTRPRFQAPFNHPTDVVVAPDGDIYVADGYGNNMVYRFSPDGTLKKSWGGLGSGPGEFATPHGINLLPDGRLLVGDRENNRVQVFSADGEYLAQWRGFYHPMDIYVESADRIYVTDQRPRVTAVNARGEAIGASKPAVAIPHGMSGHSDGSLYIVETRTTVTTKLVPVD